MQETNTFHATFSEILLCARPLYNLYSGPCVLRALIVPDNCALNLKVVLNGRFTCICVENIKLVPLVASLEIES